jgi:hypothetical protein
MGYFQSGFFQNGFLQKGWILNNELVSVSGVFHKDGSLEPKEKGVDDDILSCSDDSSRSGSDSGDELTQNYNPIPSSEMTPILKLDKDTIWEGEVDNFTSKEGLTGKLTKSKGYLDFGLFKVHSFQGKLVDGKPAKGKGIL